MSQPQPQLSPQEAYNQAMFNAVVKQRNDAQNQLAEKDAVIQMQGAELQGMHRELERLRQLLRDNGVVDPVATTEAETPAA
ncbi:hypothetical protein [Cupriavidus sp. RAF12]|uniref:hypothetical protein n=1 Tax=Cupriavidus sp. RAF12 TaxID=3233050 RepID=UPI003F90DDE7